MDDVRLTAGIVVLEEDDVTRFEAVALDVAHGEVLVDLEPDGGQVRLGLYRQPRVGPAAETTLEDAHIPVASLAEALNDPGAALLLGGSRSFSLSAPAEDELERRAQLRMLA